MSIQKIDISKLSEKEKVELLTQLKNSSAYTKYVTVDCFIEDVVDNKNYNAEFVWPENSIYDQLMAHFALEDKIFSLGGDYLDKSKWEDADAIRVLQKADRFRDTNDIVIEALCAFSYNIKENFESVVQAKEIKVLYNTRAVLSEIYEESKKFVNSMKNVDVIRNSSKESSQYNVVYEKYLFSGFIRLSYFAYEDTEDLTIELIANEGHSESWNWKEEKETYTFGDYDFFVKLDEELKEFRKEFDTGEFNKNYSILDLGDSEFTSIITFIQDFYTIHDDAAEINSKYLVLLAFPKGCSIDAYKPGESWYFTIGQNQYLGFLSSTVNGNEIVFVSLNNGCTRSYISEESTETY